MKTKLSIILMSHLSDLQMTSDEKTVKLKTEFSKWLLLQYEDTSIEIDPDEEYERFKKERGFEEKKQESVDDLNEMELKVLQHCITAIYHETGGEFGYVDDVYMGVHHSFGLRQSQVRGYLSQLSQKGYLNFVQEFEQMLLLSKSRKFVEKLLTPEDAKSFEYIDES